MALGIQTESTGGDFLPIMKFNAQAGRMYRVDRTQQADGTWAKQEIEVAPGLKFVADFANIEVGWMWFPPAGGGQPSFVMVPLGQPLPARPTDQHKQGFRMRVFSPKFLDGVREWSASSKAVLGQIDALHTQYVNAPESKQGMLPLIGFTGVTKIAGQQSTNFAPQLVLEKWVTRPPEFDAAPKRNDPAPAAQSAPPPAQPQQRPAAQHVEAPPPVAQPAPQPAMADNGAEF